MKRLFLVVLIGLLFEAVVVQAQKTPKREFRGVWVQTVYQSQYRQMNPAQMRDYFVRMLDRFQAAGINALIFQVRPQADAFYQSSIEPWSRFLTGVQGQAPESDWDPMQFLITACHARNMEFHAWLNPYRVVNNVNTEELAADHVYFQHPEWFVQYGKQILFDPGLPQSRKFICKVVEDIVSRYDVDAIHMDDYFYPYPIAGEEFPDDYSFETYREKMGFSVDERDDWRRQNVNILIKSLSETIRRVKPWVRFGISPFGIYRNKKSSPDGSDTNGLQNYDDLYADVLRWTRNGWVDYMMPQLYWELEHRAASSEKLIRWWNRYANDRHLYIGQSIERTMNATDASGKSELQRKMELSRSLPNVTGNCFWYGAQLCDNYQGVATELTENYHRRPALIPAYTFIDEKAPKKVRRLRATWTADGYVLSWKPRSTRDAMQESVYYCVYCFEKGEPIDLENTDCLLLTTRATAVILPYEKGDRSCTYVVTAVDRMHNESKANRKKVKL